MYSYFRKHTQSFQKHNRLMLSPKPCSGLLKSGKQPGDRERQTAPKPAQERSEQAKVVARRCSQQQRMKKHSLCFFSADASQRTPVAGLSYRAFYQKGRRVAGHRWQTAVQLPSRVRYHVRSAGQRSCVHHPAVWARCAVLAAHVCQVNPPKRRLQGVGEAENEPGGYPFGTTSISTPLQPTRNTSL